MSSIEKLAIRGIRSYDNSEQEVVRFYTPLTLIVGVNGSGKTTIIECLKYIVTGLMPPNAKIGGAFIHDPKLKGEKEIMAQVRLQFHSTQGHTLTAVRNLQLTVKKTARSMKTLEATLTTRRNGETSQMSNRVAELDQLLPVYLGVSTAVIDNVIFCHQEESLWPVSESSNLKKKFDEIFEAQKYTKAIANIKDIRKTQNEELGKYKILEQHAKEDKDRAKKAEQRSNLLDDTIANLRTEIEGITERMDHAGELARKAHEDSETFAKLLGQLEGKRIEARSRQENIDSLSTTLIQVDESDEWLEATLAQFDSKQQQLTQTLKSKQENYLANSDKTKNLRSQLDVKFADRGKYQQEKEEHGRQLLRRKNTIRDTAAKHDIHGFDDLSDDKQVEDFLVRIRKLAKDQQAALDQMRREHNKEKQAAQSKVNQLTERKAALQENRETASRQIDSNNREIRGYQSKVDAIPVDEGSKSVLDSRIESLNKELETAKSESEKGDWEKQLKDANSELRAQEDAISELNSELIKGTKRAGEIARLEHVRQELKEREQSLKSHLNEYQDGLFSVIGQDWEASTVEARFSDVVEATSLDLIEAEREKDAAVRQKDQVEFKLNTARANLKRAQSSMSEAHAKVTEVIEAGPDGYEDKLQIAKDQAEAARQGSGGSEVLQSYFQKCLETLTKDKKCRMCSRAFKDTTEDSFKLAKKFINQNLKKIADTMDKNLTDELEQIMTNILDVKADYETWKKLTETEIPALEQEVDTLDAERQSILKTTNKKESVLKDRQQAKADVEMRSNGVASISKANAEVKTLTKQVEELSAKQSKDGGARTLDEIEKEITATNVLMRTTKQTITKITTGRDESKSKLARLELDFSEHNGKLSNVKYQLEKKASLAARVVEFKTQNEKYKEEIEKIDSQTEQINPNIEAAKNRYDELAKWAESKEKELSQEQSRSSQSVQGLDILNESIQAYVERGGDKQLSDIHNDIQSLEDQIESVTKDQNSLTREMNKMNEQVKDGESTRRQYADNLRFRRDTKALAKLAQEIRELESHNAEVDRDRLRIESEKYTREHNNLSAKRSGLMGEMRQKDKQLEEILADFKTDFIDAPKRYKEAHIKVETTKAAVEDLARYGAALDKAIMKYHSLKMDEINTTIDELWKQTYQGTDIDTIMIKAENDTSGRSNRSYNYRTVMVKQGTEMDMRGRCSAGQKVLASIIIRLALAECFSANCGLFALDEPTTNLDRENIEGLAKALHGLIKNRQAQSNFQLVIITHDEDFLKHMRCSDFADYYYRVERDEMANSRIMRKLNRFYHRKGMTDKSQSKVSPM